MSFPHYTLVQIREEADKVRYDKCKNPDAVPIDVDAIVEFGFGIEIRPIDWLKSEADTEGMLSNDLSVIFIDSKLFSEVRFESRARFTLAHELGHFILHKNFYRQHKFTSVAEWQELLRDMDPEDLDWFERHANEFAGSLLVPRKQLITEIDGLKKEIELLKKKAHERGLGDEAQHWVNSAVARKVSAKFFVSPETISIRMRKEKLNP